MTLNWLGFVYGACLFLLHQGIKAQFLNSNCGLYDTSASRITDGNDAPLGEAPFMAYLMKNNAYICGGSIVNHRYILTAAHCVFKTMTVRLGEYDNRSNPDCVGMVCMPRHQNFGIAVIGHHSEYHAARLLNDIALIKLIKNIKFDVHIQPICLLLYSTHAPRVSVYQVFGWGQTYYEGSLAPVLQTTNLNHFPKRRCEEQFTKRLSDNQICAGLDTGTDACGADSGGPLVTKVNINGQSRYLQLGVVSHGDTYCLGTGAYTYAPSYGTWIREAMRSMARY